MPQSIHAIQNETVTEGGNVTVYCTASEVPLPFVFWVKDGQRFNGSELVLTNISRSQDGEYRCEASNECGHASKTASIDVKCKLLVNYLQNKGVRRILLDSTCVQ